MRSRRKGVLTRFISFASTSGIALGVFAAILGFSAMNGFEYELENRVLSIVPSAWLKSSGESFKDPDEILQVLENSTDIIAASPAFEQNAVLVSKQTFLPINLVGIEPESELRVIDLQEPWDCFGTPNLLCLYNSHGFILILYSLLNYNSNQHHLQTDRFLMK